MRTFSIVLLLIIAIEHLFIAFLEMTATPQKQVKAFGVDEEFLKQADARISMANQGIYNAMLAVIIILGQWIFTGINTVYANLLFSSFVCVVGFFGGLTVNKKIYFVQMLPGLVALIISCLGLYM